MADEHIPAELGRLWRVPNATRLGRPAELDVERVVRAAADLADRDGLAGVTLPKVAATLDVTKMALYRHVGSKDELFVLMGDLALGPAPKLEGAAEDWRGGLRRWAYAMRAVYAEHPWLPQLPIGGPPGGPNAIDWMDASLCVLRDTGLDWATKIGILMLVGGHVRQSGLLNQQLAAGRSSTGRNEAQTNQHYAVALAKLVDPDRFPEAAKLFAAPLFQSPPEQAPGAAAEADFELALDLILNGVAAEIAAANARGF